MEILTYTVLIVGGLMAVITIGTVIAIQRREAKTPAARSIKRMKKYLAEHYQRDQEPDPDMLRLYAQFLLDRADEIEAKAKERGGPSPWVTRVDLPPD
jgi:hypothetical protein